MSASGSVEVASVEQRSGSSGDSVEIEYHTSLLNTEGSTEIGKETHAYVNDLPSPHFDSATNYPLSMEKNAAEEISASETSNCKHEEQNIPIGVPKKEIHADVNDVPSQHCDNEISVTKYHLSSEKVVAEETSSCKLEEQNITVETDASKKETLADINDLPSQDCVTEISATNCPLSNEKMLAEKPSVSETSSCILEENNVTVETDASKKLETLSNINDLPRQECVTDISVTNCPLSSEKILAEKPSTSETSSCKLEGNIMIEIDASKKEETQADINDLPSQCCDTEISETNGSLLNENIVAEETSASETSSCKLEENITMETDASKKEDEWLDLLGSGDLKLRVIKPGVGEDSRPERGDWIVANIICRNHSGDVLDKLENFELRMGDIDIVAGLDLAIAFMQKGEQAEILVPSRLAYGKFGRIPDILPDDDLIYEVTLLNVLKKDDDQLTVSERLRLGNEKRKRGNFWYSNENCANAIICYQKACEYLDGIHDGSENPPEMLQNILDTRITVNNNLAAAHLKIGAYDMALKSLNFVLKMQPKNVKARFRIAKIWAAKGMIGDALSEMRIAAKLEPDSKVIQLELANLLRKKKTEDDIQKALYKRMLGLNAKTKTPKSISWGKWSVMAGSVLAIAVGFAAFRQYHSG